MSRKIPISMLTGLCLYLGDAAHADHASQSFGSGAAGALTALSATTLPAGKLALGLQWQTLGFRRFSDAELVAYADAGEHVHGLDRLFSGSLGLAYGVTEDFSLIASLPYVSRQGQREAAHAHEEEHPHGDDLPLPGALPLAGVGVAHHVAHHHPAGAVRDLGDASGLGDLVVLGQYRWLNDATAGLQGAWLFGLKAPTGRTDVRDADGERLEVHHQPGSGSWDTLIGAAITREVRIGRLDASLLYTHTGTGSQRTRLGRGLSYSLGFSHRLATPAPESHTVQHHEHRHESGAGAHLDTDGASAVLNWDLILELNGEWYERERQAGEMTDNTGGQLLYLAPGVRVSRGLWSAGLSLGVPVVKDLNGIQAEPDYRLLLSLGTGL